MVYKRKYWQRGGGGGSGSDPAHALAGAEGLGVADIQGAASGARILSAAQIDFAEIEALYGDRIISGAHVTFDPATGGVRTASGRRLGAIPLSSGQDAKAKQRPTVTPFGTRGCDTGAAGAPPGGGGGTPTRRGITESALRPVRQPSPVHGR